MQAAHLVRPFDRLLVWGRDGAKAQTCAEDLAGLLGIEVLPVSDPAELVAQSQLVVTTTPARAPVLRAEWLHPGLHVTAMGSDQHGKNEIDPKALAAADLYVADRVSQTEIMGELRSAQEAGVWQGGIPAELGQVITGDAPGRRSDDDITIADLTGTGAQDTAIASHVFQMLQDTPSGTVISA
jgi:ornithine cyclodeaminase